MNQNNFMVGPGFKCRVQMLAETWVNIMALVFLNFEITWRTSILKYSRGSVTELEVSLNWMKFHPLQ